MDIIDIEHSVYNFLAAKAGGFVFSSIDEFKNSKLNNELEKRFAPYFWYSVYDVDKKQAIAYLWKAQGGFEVIKTNLSGSVIEHYRRNFKDNVVYVSLDLETKELIEHYKLIQENNAVKLCKFDANTGALLGWTQDSDYNNLPESFKSKLADCAFKQSILYFAEKPYGNVVGVTKWIGNE